MRKNPKPKGADRPLLAAESVRGLFDYNAETGELFWAESGELAGSMYSTGYIMVMVGYRAYSAHRLAWAWVTRQWPKDCIDHINRDRADNRWCNLREATRSQNQWNKKGHGRSGYKGVTFCKREQRFLAQISVYGKTKHVGYFDTAEQAAAARAAAAAKHHGAFAS